MAAQGVAAALQERIAAAGGWLRFDFFADFALNHPRFGYYGAGVANFGAGGDFITAPTLSPLFGRALAAQLRPLLAATGGGVLELGGGDGALAAAILGEAPKTPYCILETSAPLAARQKERLRAFAQTRWLQTLPRQHNGVIVANEVLDALPFRLFTRAAGAAGEGGGWQERGVVMGANGAPAFAAKAPADEEWQKLQKYNLPAGYEAELRPQAAALTAQLTQLLQNGVLLFIDYGFGAPELYHPQRASGTMQCYYRRRAHDNPLVNIGEQDITAHVDFSAVAASAVAAGGQAPAYTTQANFLINGGILDIMKTAAPRSREYIEMAAAANKLLQPQEMGELFKCFAIYKGKTPPLAGFQPKTDMLHKL